MRRKSLSGHTVIAEATKATGSIMAAQMEETANARRELERSKIEVQLKLFTEQMEYQREKDRRMYENASIANENARLAIVKQGEMVSCLSKLSTVLSKRLRMSTRGEHSAGAPRGDPLFGTAPASLFPAAHAGYSAQKHGSAEPSPSFNSTEAPTATTPPSHFQPQSTPTLSPVQQPSTTSTADTMGGLDSNAATNSVNQRTDTTGLTAA